MRVYRFVTCVASFIVCIWVVQADAAQSWELFGLEDETINTILPLSPGNGENALMVGTSNGIWNHEYGQWRRVWEGLPVFDMKMIENNTILAAAGRGTDSDGVYIGNVVAIGEPGNLWEFNLLVKVRMPTAVAWRQITSGSCEGTLYVGNATGVMKGKLYDNAVSSLTSLSGPEDPWSMCTSILVPTSPSDESIWAGGTYSNRIASGISSDTALLLKGVSELSIVKKLDVLSMTEYFSVNDTLFAVATYDSGVQIFKNGGLQKSLPSPQDNYPVIAVVPFSKISANNSDWRMLCAATPAGVYQQCPPDADCYWTDLGDQIPAVVKCLAQSQTSVLWLGTTLGIYRYASTTETLADHNTVSKDENLKDIYSDHSTIKLLFTDKYMENCPVFIYDLNGKCIRNGVVTGNSMAVFNIGTGTFVYRVCRSKLPDVTGRFVCQ